MGKHRFLTAREVAELLRLNVETIYILVAKDQLPAVRVGGRWRFDEQELREWLKSQPSSSPEPTRAKEVPTGR